MERIQADLAILGAGVGGYVAAIRGAQLGLSVVLVERRPVLGGTCLNVGCIPSKVLLESSELYHQVQQGLQTHGIRVEGVQLELGQMMQRKEAVVRQLTDGVRLLMKKNRIKVLHGQGRLVERGVVEVEPAIKGDGQGDGAEQPAGGAGWRIEARNVLLATGSVPTSLPGLPFDGERIVSSDEALAFEQVPEQLVVVGAGAVGLELGSVWRRLGAQVTVVEMLPAILPWADRQVAQHLQRALKAQGVEILLGTRVAGAESEGERVKVTLQAEGGGGQQRELTCDRVLVAVGRRPYAEGLGLEQVGLSLDERGRVPVDTALRTQVDGIWAVGDLTDGPMLAHKASHEGIAVAEAIAGKAVPVRHETIPNVVYTMPELASVGLTEEAAKEQGHRVKSGRALFRANGRALSLDQVQGMVKIVADMDSDKLLGVHVAGPRASDLIAEAVLALELQASAEDLARTVHAHPTLGEVVMEAALAVDDRAIHA